MLNRKEAINKIFEEHGEDAVYVTNTGYISRAVYNEYPNNKNIFYMQGSMGLAPCIGLGMAVNTDKDIVVLSGDGALLMHLGITHTIVEEKLDNLFVWSALLVMTGFGSIGIVDDWIKISKNSSSGLNGKIKLISQVLIAFPAIMTIVQASPAEMQQGLSISSFTKIEVL